MEWVLIDTETTGFSKPVYCLEIAAQRMRDWTPYGPPFRRLINHGCPIPVDATRVHGLTAEMLAKEGQSPYDVYRDFAVYVGHLPLASYNLFYDWNQVLLPEWRRLKIQTIGRPGFCVYKLTQNLLSPSPAGSYKLQDLRQYFRLPDRGGHTALGDVYTVIDLMQAVLRPIVERHRLSFVQVAAKAVENSWKTSSPVFFNAMKESSREKARTMIPDLFSSVTRVAKTVSSKPVYPSASVNRLLPSAPPPSFFKQTWVDAEVESFEHCS